MATVTLPPSEEGLARFLRGDAAAFGDIVREHQSMVFSIAYHVLHDRGRAEEVAQDVFLRLYRHLASIKSGDHLVFWLRKVTCRRSIDEARKLPDAPPAHLEDVAEPAAESPNPDPLLSEGLRRMVASLAEDSRAVIILRYQEELELADIAEILDIPVNTVKSRLQRSLAILREKCHRWAGDVKR
ncbi:MAG: RNA polymerase sigma factor [Terriglobia bacterium]